MNQTAGINAADLRHGAEDLSAGFSELLADARQLAASISMGAHGRRRAGIGEEFWQFRTAVETDGLRDIDWRRSARSDDHFVRQQEWQNTQSIHIWVDRCASMLFRSSDDLPSKAYRAGVVGLGLSILLAKAGEKVGLIDGGRGPRQGLAQIENLAHELAQVLKTQEYGVPAQTEMKTGQKAVFISDFLGDWDQIFDGLSYAANQKVDGYLVQILDPIEQDFPFKGRTVLYSTQKGHKFETLRAQALRDEYLEKLDARKADLQQLAKKTGWRYLEHQTDQPALPALMWLYQALGVQR